MAENLPDYERHPLDEVAMGMQFEPLKHFGVQQLFKFWSSVQHTYPRIEEQQPLAHAIESTTLEPVKRQAHRLEIPPVPPLSRFWLLDSAGNNLLQIQNDRFLRNWRLRTGEEEYPRFATLYPLFTEDWNGFRRFLSGEGIGEPKIDQCEMTYVNYINIDEIGGKLASMRDAFTFLQKEHDNGFLPEPQIMKWESAYPLPEGVGRLHVAAGPAFRQRDLKLVVNFTLSARGKPSVTDDADAWFQLSHEWIVRAFDELTTPAMHKIWKKKA